MKSYKPIVTVDTSSLIKWFKTEEDREWALELRNWTEEQKIKMVNTKSRRKILVKIPQLGQVETK